MVGKHRATLYLGLWHDLPRIWACFSSRASWHGGVARFWGLPLFSISCSRATSTCNLKPQTPWRGLRGHRATVQLLGGKKWHGLRRFALWLYYAQ
jgi:hypothetical protein